MDLRIVKCPLCDDLIRLVNCTHTNPECPWRYPLMPLGLLLPVTHDIIPTTTVSENKSADTETSESDESEKEKNAKKTKKRKLNEKQKKINQDKFHLKSLTHQCPKIQNLRSKPTARRSVPKWLRTEFNTPSPNTNKPFPTEHLVDIIELMINQMEKVDVQMGCHRLILQRYITWQLRDLDSALRRSIIEVLLSVVKLHSHDSLIVHKFCDLLDKKTYVEEGEVDLYLGSIDCLLEIFCGQNNLSLSAKKSTGRLLDSVALQSDRNQQNLIGEKLFVEKICGLIRRELPEYVGDYEDEIMDISWCCLSRICEKSVANQKRFLNAGGISLFQQCYVKFGDETSFINVTTWMMFQRAMSDEKSFLPDLMSNGNLAILWRRWTDTKVKLYPRSRVVGTTILSNCSEMFTNFLKVLPADWPLGHPTIEEVKTELEDPTAFYYCGV